MTKRFEIVPDLWPLFVWIKTPRHMLKAVRGFRQRDGLSSKSWKWRTKKLFYCGHYDPFRWDHHAVSKRLAPVTQWIGAINLNTGKAIPLQAWMGPLGSRRLRLSKFLDNRHMNVVRLSALRTGRRYPQEVFFVIICVKGWVDPTAKSRPEGLCKWKFQMAPSGIDL